MGWFNPLSISYEGRRAERVLRSSFNASGF
jgi:hypothetical protein